MYINQRVRIVLHCYILVALSELAERKKGENYLIMRNNASSRPVKAGHCTAPRAKQKSNKRTQRGKTR